MPDLKIGGAVSVSHGEAGHRYECKVVDIKDNMVLLHWHGYGKRSWRDFWLDRSSDRIGSIEAADVVPPRPAKSLKAGGPVDIAGTQECDESLPALGDGNAAGAREVVLDTPVPAGECCSECSEPISKKCSEPVNWLIYSVKCDECGCRSHMWCSGLPEHMLLRAMRYAVGYKCRPCTAVKESAAGESVGDEPSLDGMRRAWKIGTGVDMDHKFRDKASSLAGGGDSNPIESERRRTETGIRPGTDSQSASISQPRKDMSVNKLNKQSKILNNDKRSTSETAASASAPASTVPVCNRYHRGICPHGGSGRALVSGKICAYAHPPKCHKYTVSGRGKYGCKRGDECKFLHPILCSSSNSVDKICTRESCKLHHLRGTKRTSVPASQGAKEPQTNKHGHGGRVTNCAASSTNRTAGVPAAAASAPSKNEDLEEIKNLISSMKDSYDEEFRAIRREIAQGRSLQAPWMGTPYPWMYPPQSTLPLRS